MCKYGTSARRQWHVSTVCTTHQYGAVCARTLLIILWFLRRYGSKKKLIGRISKCGQSASLRHRNDAETIEHNVYTNWIHIQYGKLSPSSRHTHSSSILHVRTLTSASELRPFFSALVSNQQRDATLLHACMHDQGVMLTTPVGDTGAGELNARTLNILFNGIYVDLVEPIWSYWQGEWFECVIWMCDWF